MYTRPVRTDLFFSLPTLPQAMPRLCGYHHAPPPDPHPPRAQTHAESGTHPTRGFAPDGKQKPHSPSRGRGSPATWRALPPGAQARPDCGFFACLSKSEKGNTVFALVCRGAKDRIWNSKDKKLPYQDNFRLIFVSRAKMVLRSKDKTWGLLCLMNRLGLPDQRLSRPRR